MKAENVKSGAMFLCVLLTADVINAKDKDNNFKLPPLAYPEGELEPYISTMTVQFHYGKHLAAYINNTNNLKKGTQFENLSIQEIVKEATGPLYNNAAQTFNHIFYFESLKAYDENKTKPTGDLLKLIEQNFGSFDKFKEQFSKAALTIFGSGWAWLTLGKDGKMEIIQTANGDTPLSHGKYPILTIDVWEHAYYLDTQNNRGQYIENYWNLIDWDLVAKRLIIDKM
ncbi:MAG: superoxide dismutase [Marinifilaceae bacterium]